MGTTDGQMEMSILNSSAASGTGNALNGTDDASTIPQAYRWWTLFLFVFVVGIVIGNCLVIASVWRDKLLRTTTNYIIVSLAVADMAIGVFVMPGAVYVEVMDGKFLRSTEACDAWVALDVMACTASILHMTAISVDRYLAITKPLCYIQHLKSSKIYLALLVSLSWLISIAIAFPIAVGANHTAYRTPDHCFFFNPLFSVLSSLFSFFLPLCCIILLYSRVWFVISRAGPGAREKKEQTESSTLCYYICYLCNRFRRSDKNKDLYVESNTGTSEGLAQQTGVSLDGEESAQMVIESEERPRLAAQIEPNEDDDVVHPLIDSAKLDNVAVHPHNTSDGLLDSASNGRRKGFVEPNGLHKEVGCNAVNDTGVLSEPADGDTDTQGIQSTADKNGNHKTGVLSHKDKPTKSGNSKFVHQDSDSGASSGKGKKKSERYRRDKREKRVTITLIVVVAVFIFCWIPFFFANNVNAICQYFELDSPVCNPPPTLMSVFVWLGYINSMLNPIIYAAMNPEFRRAFSQILRLDRFRGRNP